VSKEGASKSKRSFIGVLGALAFFAGMLLAIISGGIARDNGTIILVLVILGVIVGLFNITSREMIPFLVAAVALVVVGTAAEPFGPLDDISWLDGLGRTLNAMVAYIAVFMTPAAVINAVRVVWSLAQPGD
jgi:cell division protein FtsW (lipid II flippase)